MNYIEVRKMFKNDYKELIKEHTYLKYNGKKNIKSQSDYSWMVYKSKRKVRATHIAYSLFCGRSYEEIEGNSDEYNRINTYKSIYNKYKNKITEDELENEE